jgi:hypothetical protein
MRERKLYEKKRAKKGTGRAKTIPIQVSAELHQELSIIKAAYGKCLGKTVTFEQMLRRWIDRLPRIDSDVHDKYQIIRKTWLETEAGAARTAKEAMSRIFKRTQSNGTSLMEEAQNEQEDAKAALDEDLRNAVAADSPVPAGDQEQSPGPAAAPVVPKEKKTEKRFVHPDGRWFRAEMGSSTWVPVDPKTGLWFSGKKLKSEGFVLKDVEI